MLFLRRGLTVAVCVLALVGCTSDSSDESGDDAPVVQLGGPSGSNRTLSDDEAAGITAPGYTDADVAFVQGMIPHHQQALEMTAMVEQRTDSRDIRALAERMEIGQTDEIAQLENWLTHRGEDVPGEHAHHGAGQDELMPGMLTAAQLADLAAARGAAFDALFLRSMIYHHEGAVLMVEELLGSGQGGQESEVFQLAQHISSDQRVEISRMKRELAARA
jgi:uncharacterized protein (DUF305 family)